MNTLVIDRRISQMVLRTHIDYNNRFSGLTTLRTFEPPYFQYSISFHYRVRAENFEQMLSRTIGKLTGLGVSIARIEWKILFSNVGSLEVSSPLNPYI